MAETKSYLLLIREGSFSVLTLNNGHIEYIKFNGNAEQELSVFLERQDLFWNELRERESIECTEKLNISVVFDEKFPIKELKQNESWLQKWTVENIEQAVNFVCLNNVLLHFPKGKKFEKINLQKNENEKIEKLYVLGYSAESLKKQNAQIKIGRVDLCPQAVKETEVVNGLGLDYFDNKMKEYENNRVRKIVRKNTCRIRVEKNAKKK